MKTEVKVPAVGESITEATIGSWTKKSGELVKRNDIILLLETDKASVEVVAENDGYIQILADSGQVVKIGATVAVIDSAAQANATSAGAAASSSTSAVPSMPAPQTTTTSNKSSSNFGGAAANTVRRTPTPPPPFTGSNAGAIPASIAPTLPPIGKSESENLPLSPAVQKLVQDNQLDASTIAGSGKDGRVTKGDVLGAVRANAANLEVNPSSMGNNSSLAAQSSAISASATNTSAAASSSASMLTAISSSVATPSSPSQSPTVSSTATPSQPAVSALRPAANTAPTYLVPMTTIRKKIAERLVEAQSTAAILTTFNEIDMSRVIEIRNKYKDKFKEKYGINLGFMGFFVKAAIEALKAYPAVNAFISGTNIEYHNYYNVGVAVSTDRGLMVPVIKNAHLLTMAQIELAIREFANKARDGKISIDDLSGGTFTVTNGGVFGSLMSTPILNPPQSGILGMHKLEDRAIVIDKKVEVRTMMYVALSYDHRIIDGRDSVGFLVKIKEGVEDPERLLIEV